MSGIKMGKLNQGGGGLGDFTSWSFGGNRSESEMMAPLLCVDLPSVSGISRRIGPQSRKISANSFCSPNN